MLLAVVVLLAGVPSSAPRQRAWADVLDTLLTDDTIPQDTIIETKRPAAAALKRDTSTMDSLQLAIYKHNKAIDDSLALDSLNHVSRLFTRPCYRHT